ncbi:MAG: hypothetical protein JWM82_595, partial [Myxococcales bacterium]|nr:hypothetical protein [Myxococcales bacterium]
LKDRLRRAPLSLLPAAVVLAIVSWVFVVLNDQMFHYDFAYDESYFVWCGWCITKGLVVYRDFMEFKAPVLFFTHALAVAVFGLAGFGYRWFFLLFPLGSVLALMAAVLSRGIGKLATLALGLAIVQLWVNMRYHDTALTDSESVGLAYYFLAVACLVARTRFGDRLKIAGGAFLVACALSKEPFLLTAIATWAACFLLDVRRPTQRAEAVAYFKATAIGGGALVAVLCLYMIPTGAMKAYVNMVSGYINLYRDPKMSYCVLLGRFHPTTPLNDLLVQYRQVRHEYLNLEYLGYLVPFLLVTLVFTMWRSPLLLAATFVAIVFGFSAVTASNCLWFHYYNMTMGGLFFACIVGLDSMTRMVRSPLVRGGVGLALLVSALWVTWPRYEAEVQSFGTRTTKDFYRELIPGSFAAIAKYTTPADNIVTTGPPLLYMQVDRKNGVKESTIMDEALGFYQGDTDEQRLSGVRAELELNMPKIVVLDPENEHRKVRHNRALMMPFLNAHRYTEVSPHVWLRPN